MCLHVPISLQLIHTFQQSDRNWADFLENTVIKQSKLLTNINNKSHLIESMPTVLKENQFQTDSICF